MIKFSSLKNIKNCIFCGNMLKQGRYLDKTSERSTECRDGNTNNYHVCMIHNNGFALRTYNYVFSIYKGKITHGKIKGEERFEFRHLASNFSELEELIEFMRNDYLLQ